MLLTRPKNFLFDIVHNVLQIASLTIVQSDSKKLIWLVCLVLLCHGCSSSSDSKREFSQFIRSKGKDSNQAYSFFAVSINPHNNFISIYSGEYRGIEEITTNCFIEADTSFWNLDPDNMTLQVKEHFDNQDGNQELFGYNNEYRFVLGERNDGVHFIQNLKDRQELGFSYGVSANHFSIANWGLSFDDLVNDPRVAIITFNTTLDQERELSVVEGEFLEKNGVIKFTLLLDSLNGFVQREIMPGSQIIVKYKEVESGTIPKLVETWTENDGNLTLARRLHFLNHVPIENFNRNRCRLSYYGIDSPYDASKQWFSPVWVVFIVIGTIMLLIFIFRGQ